MRLRRSLGIIARVRLETLKRSSWKGKSTLSLGVYALPRGRRQVWLGITVGSRASRLAANETATRHTELVARLLSAAECPPRPVTAAAAEVQRLVTRVKRRCCYEAALSIKHAAIGCSASAPSSTMRSIAAGVRHLSGGERAARERGERARLVGVMPPSGAYSLGECVALATPLHEVQ